MTCTRITTDRPRCLSYASPNACTIAGAYCLPHGKGSRCVAAVDVVGFGPRCIGKVSQ